MEPERVKAYLQAACAGLGFDIGEVWWTSNENGSSTVAAIGKRRCCPHTAAGACGAGPWWQGFGQSSAFFVGSLVNSCLIRVFLVSLSCHIFDGWM